MRDGIVVAAAPVVAAVALLAAAALLEQLKALLYFRPSHHFPETVETYAEVTVGHLRGRLLAAPGDGGHGKIVLLCHGNASNVALEEWRMTALRDRGYAVLVFDYSGYGRSLGVPSEGQMYKDASAMAALLLETHRRDQIVLYGMSMGAPVATYVARRYAIPTLILESPLSSMRAVVGQRSRALAILCPEFDTASHLASFHGADVKARSLVMHSPDDEIVPYESVRPLIRTSTRHIRIGGTHDHPVLPWDEIVAFIGGS